MLFCCLRRNIETSCHKNFVVVSRHQQAPPLTTSDRVTTAVRRRRVDNISRSQRRQHAMIKPDTGRKSRFFAYPPAFGAPVRGLLSEYCHPVWYLKTMVWLPDGEKIFKISLFFSTESTNVIDGRTDGRTPQDGIA